MHKPLPLPLPSNRVRYQVLAYLRVSNDLQQDNHTFETQEKRIRRKLDDRYGVDCYDIKVYKDDGLSGGFGPVPTGIESRTRPTLLAIQSDLLSGSYDVFAIYQIDRLARSARVLLDFVEDVILRSGVDFISATEDYDITTPEGRMIMAYQAVNSAAYREACVKRNRDAMAARVEDGFNLGLPPYGWQYEPRQDRYAGGRRGIVRNSLHSDHLLYMKDRYFSGVNCIKIAGELNTKGILSSRGKRWDAKAISCALKNPIHAGLISCKRSNSLLEGRHHDELYWDRETYEEILEIGKKRRRAFKTNTGKADSPHFVNGIICCAQCGERLYLAFGRKYRGYRCVNGRRHGQPTCPEVTIRAESVETAVIREMERAALDPTIRQILLSAAERSAHTEESRLDAGRQGLLKVLQNNKKKLDRLVDCLGRGVIKESSFKDAERKLHQEQKESSEHLEQIEKILSAREQREARGQKLQQAILDFPLCWKHATLDERRHLMLTLVEKLTISRSGRDAIVTMKIYLLPERVFGVNTESARHLKDRPLGVEGLTRRQLAFLHYVGLGQGYKEIASHMGTGISNVYTSALYIRRALGVHDMQEAYKMTRQRIEEQLAFLPLGPTRRCTLKLGGPIAMTPCLREVLPLLARGASYTEVSRRLGLTPNAVSARRKRILEVFQTNSIFEAGERARALGLLNEIPRDSFTSSLVQSDLNSS